MIPRYSRPEMLAIWSDDNRYRAWLDVELAHLDAREARHTAPEGVARRIREAVAARPLDAARILEIEKVCRHDVIAFLTHVEEVAGPEARFLHVGLTSSDVLDSSLAMLMVEAADRILDATDGLLGALRTRAEEHKNTPMVGRSHGIHAELTTFGLALAGFWAELSRGRTQMAEARRDIGFGKLSGAVGTFSATEPEVEVEALAALGLGADPVSTQVVSRDRHARYFCALAGLAATCERIAVQVRHWQRTEVREAEEPFRKGQKGSSAMPHKRNPILTENVTGLARLVRGHAATALENVALWHERDISHSSVERIIGPDATTLTDFMLRRLTTVIADLVVYPEHMRKNIGITRGLVFSGHVLLALVGKGMERQEAYVLVQRNALPAWEEGSDFVDNLKQDADVTALLTNVEIDTCFDARQATRHVDSIFDRVFVD
ncbi:MAG: adenylosuccinate lyase [Myxococcota bacterium]|jgi:adenylosuccinate lyase